MCKMPFSQTATAPQNEIQNPARQCQTDCHAAVAGEYRHHRLSGLPLPPGIGYDPVGAGRDCGRPGRFGQRAVGPSEKYGGVAGGLCRVLAGGAGRAGAARGVSGGDGPAGLRFHHDRRGRPALPHHLLRHAGGGGVHHADLQPRPSGRLVRQSADDFVRCIALQRGYPAAAHPAAAPPGAGSRGRSLFRTGCVPRCQSRFFRPRRNRRPGAASNRPGHEKQPRHPHFQPLPQRPVLPHTRPAPPSAHHPYAALLLRRPRHPRTRQLQPHTLPRHGGQTEKQRPDFPLPTPDGIAGAGLPRHRRQPEKRPGL